MLEVYKKKSEMHKEYTHSESDKNFYTGFLTFKLSQYKGFNNPFELMQYLELLEKYIWYKFVDVTIYPEMFWDYYIVPKNPVEQQSGLRIAQLLYDLGDDLHTGKFYGSLVYLDEVQKEIQKVLNGQVVVNDTILLNAIYLLSKTNLYTLEYVASLYYGESLTNHAVQYVVGPIN